MNKSTNGWRWLIELSSGSNDCSVHGQFDKNHKANYSTPNYKLVDRDKMTSILSGYSSKLKDNTFQFVLQTYKFYFI